MANLFGWMVIVCPIITLFILGITGLVNRPLEERMVDRLCKLNVTIGLIGSLGILFIMLVTGARLIPLEMDNFVNLPTEHYIFHIEFIFDRLSIPMAIMSFVLVGVVGSFANVYLHRDAGYHRFFFCFSMFLVGLIFAFMAGTIETLFLGWELVGLSSALLIAYFQERTAPVENGQRVWSIYRFADAAFLTAAIAMHHLVNHGEFTGMAGREPWPTGVAQVDGYSALLVGLLLLVAAAGKSGLIPFSGWLPRAMEGPTPSSAVFYGALSIHLGAYLLLRVTSLLQASSILTACVIVLGAATAVFASAASRVQTDVKSMLAYASVSQVGIIVAEIGLGYVHVGFLYLALIHMIGHAFLRSLQLLRAPTLLRDYKTLENAIGGRLVHGSFEIVKQFSPKWQVRLYRLCLERGYMDALMDDYIVRPFQKTFLFCDSLERKWTNLLSGRKSDPDSPEEISTPPSDPATK